MRATAIFVLLISPALTFGQEPDGEQPSTASEPATPPFERPVSWRKLPTNILQDQKAIWTSPVKLKEPKYLIPTAGILAATIGLVAIDPAEGQYFRNTSAYNGFNNAFSSTVTTLGIIAAPVALYGIGLVEHNDKAKSTALLAGEAVADAEILTTVFKAIDHRTRPAAVPKNGNFSDTWFEDHTNVTGGSFPSGHTIAAFSVATVIARRYGNHKWVPYVAYGAATLVGFSRLSLSAHFASDVFVGGVLGYSISRFAVLRQ